MNVTGTQQTTRRTLRRLGWQVMECERCGCECEYTQEMWALCTEEPMHPDAPDCQACGCTCCVDDGCEEGEGAVRAR